MHLKGILCHGAACTELHPNQTISSWCHWEYLHLYLCWYIQAMAKMNTHVKRCCTYAQWWHGGARGDLVWNFYIVLPVLCEFLSSHFSKTFQWADWLCKISLIWVHGSHGVGLVYGTQDVFLPHGQCSRSTRDKPCDDESVNEKNLFSVYNI